MTIDQALVALYDGLDDFRLELERSSEAMVGRLSLIDRIVDILKASERAEKLGDGQTPVIIRLRVDDDYVLALSRATSLIPHLADADRAGVLIVPVRPTALHGAEQ